MLKSLALIFLAPAIAYAAKCTEAPFRSELIGTKYPIVQPDNYVVSPSGKYEASISGSLVIVDRCTVKLDPLILFNAPAEARIKLYARRQSDHRYAFPINDMILKGQYNEVPGPSFPLTQDWVNGTVQGLSFNDFDQIVVFAEADRWVIAFIDLPKLENYAPLPSHSSGSGSGSGSGYGAPTTGGSAGASPSASGPVGTSPIGNNQPAGSPAAGPTTAPTTGSSQQANFGTALKYSILSIVGAAMVALF